MENPNQLKLTPRDALPKTFLNSYPSAWQLIAKRYKKPHNCTQGPDIRKIFPRTPPKISLRIFW